MKEELLNPKKIRIPYDIIYGDKILDPHSKLGCYLKSVLDCEGQIKVNKIWINKETDEKLDEIIIPWIMKTTHCGKKRAVSQMGWYKLGSGAAVDFDDSLNLETDYIYVEEDFEVKK